MKMWYILLVILTVYFVYFLIWRRRKRKIINIYRSKIRYACLDWAGLAPMLSQIILSLGFSPKKLPSFLTYKVASESGISWEGNVQVQEAFTIDKEMILAMLNEIEDDLFIYYITPFRNFILPTLDLITKKDA